MPHKLPKIGWFLILFLFVLPVFAQKTQKRIALVIGNSNFGYSSNSINATVDASDVADALTELGFEVNLGINKNRQQTENMIDAFLLRLKKSKGVGLIYYSGLGFQSNGESFLVPVDANLTNKEETLKKAISINALLKRMKPAKNYLNLVLLDAIRTNFSREKETSIFDNAELAKVSPPNTLIFYSSEKERITLLKCDRRNGLFAESFLNQLKKGSFEFKELAKNVSDEVSQKTKNFQKPFLAGVSSRKFYPVDQNHQFKPIRTPTLEDLYNNYRVFKKCPCGENTAAISTGKEILKNYKDDKDNAQIIKFVEQDIQKLEKSDAKCSREKRYNSSYKANNWDDFMVISKLLMELEENQDLLLDLMLTHVSIGYDRIVVDKKDSYIADTVFFAKKAIQMIESGSKSKTGKWGIFAPFNKKGEALGWLNFMIADILNNKQKQPKAALPYYFKAIQNGTEKKNDISIYYYVGNYYFDEAAKLDTESREKRVANDGKDTPESTRLLGYARAYAERGIDAFGRAYKIATQTKANPKQIEAIRKSLEDLYRFRFNIAPDLKPEGVDVYFEKLISQPMPDPAKPIEPVLP